MTQRDCCCENNCGVANCFDVRQDCYTVGLQPFSVNIGITMYMADCRNLDALEIFCDNSSCGSWGESNCGGCIPCDPLGTMPGANGRVCPCPTETCGHPPGVHLPYLVCETVNPVGNSDGCRYAHPDYWYLTWNSTGNSGCSLPTIPQCDWVGSHTCAFELVRIPAGFDFVEFEPLYGVAFNLDVDRLAKCGNVPGFHDLPWPSTDSPMFGWPHDCEFSPPPCGGFEFGGCMCTCKGIFPTWQLRDTPNFSCDETGNFYRQTTYARINWAVPCASSNQFGGILACGDQCPCDSEQYSYVSVTFFGSTSKFASDIIGDLEYDYVDPDNQEEINARCQELVGDPNTTPSGAECSGSEQLNIGIHCQDHCCVAQYNQTIIFRRKRNPADATCSMAKGDYEVVGLGPCGDFVKYGCGLGTQAEMCAKMPKCAPRESWDEILEKHGITYYNFEIY